MPGSPTHIWKSITDAYKASHCLVMGIVNVTPDSFSDGGVYLDTGAAAMHALRLAEEGAAIVDIGGESTRPGAVAVETEDELRRVVPVIEALRKLSDVPISIDTRKAEVAHAACAAGADIINDVSALTYDSGMVRVALDADVPVVLMHMKGSPATMQQTPAYSNVMEEVHQYLAERIAYCREQGLRKLIADPGIGFGKKLEHNTALLRDFSSFRTLDVPLLLGASRKRFIGDLTGVLNAQDRLGGSIAAALLGAMSGATIVRVHDVQHTCAALKILDAVSIPGETAHVI